jgi:hypothetical protein
MVRPSPDVPEPDGDCRLRPRRAAPPLVRLVPLPPLGRDQRLPRYPAIGPLVLLQSISVPANGIEVVAVRRHWAAVIGIGFALPTVAGFLASVARGLFGFKDSWLAPHARQAFTVEWWRRRCSHPSPRSAWPHRFPTLAPARPRPGPRRREHSGPGLRPLLPVGTRARLPASWSAQPGEQVVLGDRRVGRVDGPDEALRSHDGGEQLLAHL